MNPPPPPVPERPAPPTVGEIAELTARLRAISRAGAGVDPAERAAFLADKDALLARIAEADRAAVDQDQARDEPSTAELVGRSHRAVADLPLPSVAGPGERERRDHLAAWHADDQAAEDSTRDADALGGSGDVRER
jgi:hypothetical protein